MASLFVHTSRRNQPRSRDRGLEKGKNLRRFLFRKLFEKSFLKPSKTFLKRVYSFFGYNFYLFTHISRRNQPRNRDRGSEKGESLRRFFFRKLFEKSFLKPSKTFLKKFVHFWGYNLFIRPSLTQEVRRELRLSVFCEDTLAVSSYTGKSLLCLEVGKVPHVLAYTALCRVKGFAVFM